MVKAVLVGKAASVVRMVSVEPGLEVMDKLRRVCGNADPLTVRLNLLGILLPCHQLVAIVAETLAPRNTEIPGFEFHHRAGQHTEFQISAVDTSRRARHAGGDPSRPSTSPVDPREIQRPLWVPALPRDRQLCRPRMAMAQDKGHGLLQGRIRTGRGGPQKRQDIQAGLAMGRTAVGGRASSCCRHTPDGLRIASRIVSASSPISVSIGLEPLVWGLTGLPASDDLPQQGDQCIGLLLVLAAVFLQGFFALVMELLQAADQHLGQVIQGLGRPDADQGHGQRDPFGSCMACIRETFKARGLVGKALQFGFRDAVQRLARCIQGL